MFLANQLSQWLSELDNEDDRRQLFDPKHKEKGHGLVKRNPGAAGGESFRCARRKDCLSGSMTEEDSTRLFRYQCIACDHCLCESCAKKYADGKTLPDILCLKRPQNKTLWGLKYEESAETQHASSLNFFRGKYNWSLSNGHFSSSEVEAYNFAKAIPLDNKYMVMLGGIKGVKFPPGKSEAGEFNIFVVDVLTN